jgi:hypothetical protein
MADPMADSWRTHGGLGSRQDLLYGSARRALSETYMGVGDRLVPLDKVRAYTPKSRMR